MAKKGRAADTLATNLVRLMGVRHIKSQPQLSSISKVSQKTINNIVHKRNSPQLDSVEKLAHALGVELYQLLCPIEEQNFLAVCLAWAQSDDRGKEDLRTIAEAVLKKRGTVADEPANNPGSHRARGGAG